MRVLCATQAWGVVTDYTTGNSKPGASVTLTTPSSGAVTVYSAQTGGGALGALVTAADGTVPGWIDEGSYLMTASGVTRRIEAQGAVPANVHNVLSAGDGPVLQFDLPLPTKTYAGPESAIRFMGGTGGVTTMPRLLAGYITASCQIYTGCEIVSSNKRSDNDGTIQNISSTSDGSEPSMISASVDIDGPAFAGEAYTANTVGFKNASAFAAYDLNDVSGGAGAQAAGYGRKKWVVEGDGEQVWGTDLLKDPRANGDLALKRGGAGTMELRNPPGTADVTLRLKAAAGHFAQLTLGSVGTDDNLILSTQANLEFAYLQLHTRVMMRFYSKPLGVSGGGAIAVGGVDDGTAVGVFAVDAAATAALKGLVARGKSGQTGNLLEVQDSTPTVLGGFTENGYFFTAKTTVIADAELAAGEMALWFDATNGAAKLMVKAKQANGTVRTGSLALV